MHRAFIDLLSDDEHDNEDLFIQQSIEESFIDGYTDIGLQNISIMFSISLWE